MYWQTISLALLAGELGDGGVEGVWVCRGRAGNRDETDRDRPLVAIKRTCGDNGGSLMSGQTR